MALSPLICVLHISRATNRARRRRQRARRASQGRRPTGPRVSKNIRGSDGANGRARAAAVTSTLPRRSAKNIAGRGERGTAPVTFFPTNAFCFFPLMFSLRSTRTKKVLRISMCMHDKMVTKSRRDLRRSTLLEISDFVHASVRSSSVQIIILQQKLGYERTRLSEIVAGDTSPTTRCRG